MFEIAQRWTVNVILLTAFIISAVGVAGANSWDQRLGQTDWWRNCYINLIATNSVPRQIIFLGTSRTRLGVNPDQIAAQLGLPQDSIANLATTGRTPDFQYEVMDELTKSGNIKLVMVELSISSQYEINIAKKNSPIRAQHALRPSGINTPAAIRFASFDQIRLAITYLPYIAAAHDSVFIFLNKWSVNLQSNIRRLGELSGIVPVRTTLDNGSPNVCRERADAKMPYTTRYDRLGIRSSKSETASISAANQTETAANMFQPDYPPQNIQVIKKMSEMSKSRAFELVFFQMPPSKFTVSNPEDIERFENLFGHKLIVPDTGFWVSVGAKDYADQSHMSKSGAERMSHWLAEQMSSPSMSADR